MGRSKDKDKLKSKSKNQPLLAGWWQKFGLDPRIVAEYDLEVQKAEPVGRRWRLETDRGVKCLTRHQGEESEVLFLHSVLEQLAKQGFKQIPRLIRTRYGQPYVVGQGEYYYLSDWFEGRKLDLSNREQLAAAAESLGRLHGAGRGFEQAGAGKRQPGDWVSLWKYCAQELVDFKTIAEGKSSRTRFDKTYLAGAEQFIAQAERAIERLQDVGGQTEELATGICHPRYDSHHLLINPKRDVFVFGFEHCKAGWPVFDLGRFTQRVMAREGWDQGKGEQIITAYQKVNPLSQTEGELLLAFLEFPGQFWQYAHAYYCQDSPQPDKKLLAGLDRVLKDSKNRGIFLNRLENKA